MVKLLYICRENRFRSPTALIATRHHKASLEGIVELDIDSAGIGSIKHSFMDTDMIKVLLELGFKVPEISPELQIQSAKPPLNLVSIDEKLGVSTGYAKIQNAGVTGRQPFYSTPKKLTKELLDKQDIVLCMNRAEYDFVSKMAAHPERVHTLGGYAGFKGKKVPEPTSFLRDYPSFFHLRRLPSYIKGPI
ncbi:MAG: hypothetical protein AABX25_00200, partial [Nanoarchaeota archaeon]